MSDLVRFAPRAILVGALSVGVARAEEAPIAVSAVGNCPRASDVVRSLQTLLPRRAISESAGAATVVLTDEGPSYRVRIDAGERTFADEGRRCDERARAAAVVVALELEPPSVGDVPQLPPPRPRAKVQSIAPTPAVVAHPPRSIGLDLEAAVAFALAPDISGGGTVAAGGGRIRALVRRKILAAFVGVEGLSPVELNFGAANARIVRVPIDAGARLSFRRGRVELGGSVALVFAIDRIDGQGLPIVQSSTRLDLGAEFGLLFAVWPSERWAIALAPEVTWSFLPYNLTVDPAGRVGRTPPLWVGGTLGVVWRFFR